MGVRGERRGIEFINTTIAWTCYRSLKNNYYDDHRILLMRRILLMHRILLNLNA